MVTCHVVTLPIFSFQHMDAKRAKRFGVKYYWYCGRIHQHVGISILGCVSDTATQETPEVDLQRMCIESGCDFISVLL
jgi:hypothetical protein